MSAQESRVLRTAPLATPTDLKPNAVRDLAGELNILLADMFGLYLKTKNFHWHISGPHFRDYHLLLDEQSEQIFATTDAIAERVRKIGATTLRSIGHVSRLRLPRRTSTREPSHVERSISSQTIFRPGCRAFVPAMKASKSWLTLFFVLFSRAFSVVHMPSRRTFVDIQFGILHQFRRQLRGIRGTPQCPQCRVRLV